MIDNLKNFCAENHIQLVYTNNKYTILSSGFQNSTPMIRAQRFFKDCTEEIAKAIVYYYIDYKNKEKYLKLIDKYVKKEFKIDEYKINPPELNFLNYFKDNTSNHKEELSNSFIEANISSMIIREFGGEAVNINGRDSINVSDDSITEIDIIINPHNK
jgi:hypothetical protein